MKKNKSLLLSTPYILWMVVFTLIPLGVVGYYALTDPATGAFTLDNIRNLNMYWGVLWQSIAYSLISAMICLVLGGMSVRSPYSWIGSQRKIMQMLGVEPVFLVMILALYLRNGSFLGSALFSKGEPLLLSMPLMFLAFLCAIAIEMEKSPFDLSSSHHAHQEIVKGVTLEYSGPFLGIIEIAHFYEFAFFFGLMMAFWHTNIIIGLVVAFAGLIFLAVLDNSFARLTPNWMLRFMWTVPLSMALANLIWLWVK